MPAGFSASPAVFEQRGVHLDFKGVPPTFDRLLSLVDLFAAARYNVILVEWEDAFPWTVDQRMRSETAYSPQQVRQFVQHAARRGLEIIPLVQCLGHLENALGWPGKQYLWELPDRSDVLNVLADGAGRLVRDMIDDVLALCPDVRRFHLGGDEAWTFGSHPDTQAFIGKHGKAALYLQHIQPLLDHLNDRSIRPILWHDMMIHWSAEELASLARSADLMVWGYRGHPDQVDKGNHFHRSYIDHLAKAGVPLWCAGAFKGADGMSSDLPDFNERRDNALAWADVHRSLHFIGAVATGWSRYCTATVQCEPIDAALDALVNVGHIFHDGQSMPGDQRGCEAFLQNVGEFERFARCRDALRTLAEARRLGWMNAADLREMLVTLRQDPRRRTGPMDLSRLKNLQRHVDESLAASVKIRSAFAGLIDDLWINRYLDERIQPLQSELARLAPEFAAVRSTVDIH